MRLALYIERYKPIVKVDSGEHKSASDGADADRRDSKAGGSHSGWVNRMKASWVFDAPTDVIKLADRVERLENSVTDIVCALRSVAIAQIRIA